MTGFDETYKQFQAKRITELENELRWRSKLLNMYQLAFIVFATVVNIGILLFYLLK
jgi:hypothetical protein